MSASIAYVAAGLVAFWGVAHAIPIAQVVSGFAPISADNHRVLTQEWLTEARTRVSWFKVCPILLGSSAALLIVASLI